ncbi:MAG: type II secretion system ATPase GspE [Chthonomonadales bacterium]|nr:type II secretion system ATPase GspE [Chthonomonadales bacterium]
MEDRPPVTAGVRRSRRIGLLTLKRTPLGAILVEKGVITPEQLDQALAEQRRQSNAKRIGQILIDMRFASEQAVLSALSEQLECPLIDINVTPPDPEALQIVPSEFALRHHLLPLQQTDHTLTVAMADPLDVQSIDDLRLLTGFSVRPMLASPQEINRAVQQFYMSRMLQDVEAHEQTAQDDESLDVADLQKMAREELVIQMVNMIINQGIQDRASDIHIEPFERELRVRYRIDGVLHEINAPPKRFHPAIISRIKILSDMNIAERRLPQDGRMRLRAAGRQIDLRVSTVPTLYGESAVLRILDKQTAMLGLRELGMHGLMFERFRRLIQEPHGIILVTGPTGSGKTTTLYAALNEIYSTERKIITIEDPVEYQLNGINQIQVHPQIDLTFANGLRHIVRQDPDIIMVGEIRDTETVEIAIHAALTGHLVFSTLHTNDAAGAVSRMLDMGAEPYLVASSLIGTIAQRLVRVNCPRCRRPVTEKAVELHEIGISEAQAQQHPLHAGAGCPECRGVGYRGRSGLFEMLTVDDAMRQMIVRREPATVIKQYGVRQQGMVTLLQDGRRRALAGDTTVKEVLRVCQREDFE